MGSAWNRRLGAWARWVLLVPVLLMSLIPAGAMPGHAADGTITLVLCTADGVEERRIDLATGEPAEEPADSGACDWACGQFAPALDSPPLAPLPLRVAAGGLEPPPLRLLLAEARATGLPPATGPPPAV